MKRRNLYIAIGLVVLVWYVIRRGMVRAETPTVKRAIDLGGCPPGYRMKPGRGLVPAQCIEDSGVTGCPAGMIDVKGFCQ
ncbi:MAG TPA: hypothetical protein VII92_20625 [Anaerolineae bacterium]